MEIQTIHIRVGITKVNQHSRFIHVKWLMCVFYLILSITFPLNLKLLVTMSIKIFEPFFYANREKCSL